MLRRKREIEYTNWQKKLPILIKMNLYLALGIPNLFKNGKLLSAQGILEMNLTMLEPSDE